MSELFQQQQSIEYIVQTGYSAFVGFTGSTISYLDKELQHFILRPFNYPIDKIVQYGKSVIQGYMTRILVDQANLYVSLLKSTEYLSDKFLQDYINPFVSSTVGLMIGIGRYMIDWNKDKRVLNSINKW